MRKNWMFNFQVIKLTFYIVRGAIKIVNTAAPF